MTGQTTTANNEDRGALAFGLRPHPTHRLTRDAADGADHWHRCMACLATDAAGDARLATACPAAAASGAAMALDALGEAQAAIVAAGAAREGRAA